MSNALRLRIKKYHLKQQHAKLLNEVNTNIQNELPLEIKHQIAQSQYLKVTYSLLILDPALKSLLFKDAFSSDSLEHVSGHA
jgi:hypothetical protein